MNKAFYPRMAVSNIIKNKKTYFPYIITCILTIMMYYMMNSILQNTNVQNMNGGTNVCIMLMIGLWVTAIFAVIFLFYTNSFLIKRRQKEIGLYNILGMEKRHIGFMMFYETLITALITISLGIILGIVFGKLMFLLLFKLIGTDSIPAFQVPVISIIQTLILSFGIFFAILLYNLARIQLTKPIELVHGGQIGEREPKTKIILTIIGLLTMGAGYYFALFVDSPFAAISFFLLAVILVIVGTYCLFTSGSIALIKLLRKNKNYYYKAKHFTSVSGMLYRMKQNAVGLANISILSTMVLISVATTVSMYIGMEDTVQKGYPKEINVSITTEGTSQETVDKAIQEVIDRKNVTISNYTAINSLTLYCGLTSGSDTFEVAESDNIMEAYADKLSGCLFMGLDEFNKINHSSYQLSDGEILLYTKEKYTHSDLQLTTPESTIGYQIKEKLEDISSDVGFDEISSLFPCYLVILKDQNAVETVLSQVVGEALPGETETYTMDYSVGFDTNLSKQESMELSDDITRLNVEGATIWSSSQYEMRDEFHQMYGGFFFIGIFVGVLFLMATVLIIYYKQISEGYDDKERFEIMQKVGMSKSEVKKTIRSQVLTVFFLPLAVATLHVVVSFRIIKMILSMLSLGNSDLFALCTVITVCIFCAIYGLVFSITAKSYYKIVSVSM